MFFSELFFLVPLLFIAVLVVGAVGMGSRRDADPTGRRPLAIYLLSVIFVALVTALISLTAIAGAGARLVVGSSQGGNGGCLTNEFGEVTCPPGGSSGNFGFQSTSQNDNPQWVQLAQSGMALIAALLVLAFHGRKAKELAHEPQFLESAAVRAFSTYMYAMCFVTLLLLVGAAIAAFYGLFRVVAPGTTGLGDPAIERDGGIVQLVTAGTLALASLFVFRDHWGRTSRLVRPSVPAADA
jgi:chromate transport protein ChrA